MFRSRRRRGGHVWRVLDSRAATSRVRSLRVYGRLSSQAHLDFVSRRESQLSSHPTHTPWHSRGCSDHCIYQNYGVTRTMAEAIQQLILDTLDKQGEIKDTRTLILPGYNEPAATHDSQIIILGALNSLSSRDVCPVASNICATTHASCR